MKATLCDVHIVERDIELPEACPHCDADLTAGLKTMVAMTFQEKMYLGALDLASGHFEKSESEDPDDGPSRIEFVSYSCVACGKPIAQEASTEAHVGDLAQGAEHTHHTLELWWEALRENPSLRCGYEAWVARCLKVDKEN